MSVLDASALLAFVLREPGEDEVARHLKNGRMSTVNLSEVVGRFVRLGHAGADVMRGLDALGIEWVEFDVRLAQAAADLIPTTHRLGLSLADRACLALALSRNETAVTADQDWAQLSLAVPVVLIR